MFLNNWLLEEIPPCKNFCKVINAILWHKILILPFYLACMYYSNNFSIYAWILTVLHGVYGQFYVLKNFAFPYQNFQQPASLGSQIFLFIGLMFSFYSIGFYHIVVAKDSSPTKEQTVIGITLYLWGVLLEFIADTQKEVVLQHKRGLITDGMFSYSRNTNYFGDVLMYIGLIVIAAHGDMPYRIIPALGLIFLFFQIMLPLMILKDKSLSRYETFQAYKETSGFLIPNVIAIVTDMCGKSDKISNVKDTTEEVTLDAGGHHEEL